MSEEALRKASDKQFYGRLGPASPVKRIDPKTGEVVEIISGVHPGGDRGRKVTRLGLRRHHLADTLLCRRCLL
jgi:hypothetical protein